MISTQHMSVLFAFFSFSWCPLLLIHPAHGYAYSTPPSPPSSSHQVSTTESTISSRTSAVRSTARLLTDTTTLKISNNRFISPLPKLVQKGMSTLALAAAITVSSSTTNVPIAHADYDNAEDTVETVLQNLKDSTGDSSKTFKVFESISEIITEGKGVGGSLSYSKCYTIMKNTKLLVTKETILKSHLMASSFMYFFYVHTIEAGVKLERGFVADEDTTIYNPGLSLLTESEKTSIVNAIIENRKGNIAAKSWSQDNEYAFDFLKTRLDPLHMVELSSYLKVLPFLGGAVYLFALAVQQFARGLFEVVYVVSALVVFIPILALIAAGV